MPSFTINENIINEKYILKLKNTLNSSKKWVEFEEGKCDLSNNKNNAKYLVNNIDNCTHLINKFFSTLYLNNDNRNILPPTYYLVDSKWLSKEPVNDSCDQWIIKDVWDYSQNNSQIYSNIPECLSNVISDKYYVIQPYIDNLILVKCYVLIFRHEDYTEFYLFKDGYYNNNEQYERFQNLDKYDKYYNHIKDQIEKHISSINNSINKKSTDINEFQLFEYEFGIKNDDIYLLNCSIQLSIYKKENKVFNILTNIITTDLVNDLIEPVIDNMINVKESKDETETDSKDKTEMDSKDETETDSKDKTEMDSKDKTETDSKDETEMDSKDETETDLKDEKIDSNLQINKYKILNNNRWDKLVIDTSKKEISDLFLEVIEKSKKKIHNLSNNNVNTFYFDSINSNNVLYGLQKILEGLDKWKHCKKNTDFSDNGNPTIQYGLKLEHILNMSTISSLLESNYIPTIYNNYNEIKSDENDCIWHIKNINSGEYKIDTNINNLENTTNMVDDFVFVDEEDVIIYQKELDNLMLINNRKFIIKIFCLVSNTKDSDTKNVHNVLLYTDGIIFCASTDYEKSNTNLKIHDMSEISSKENDISTYALHFSDWNKYNTIYPIISTIINNLFTKILSENKIVNNGVQLYSFDFTLDNSNKVYLVNIHNNPVIMNDKRLWCSTMKTMFNMLFSDIIEMIVVPYLNNDNIEFTSRWNKII